MQGQEQYESSTHWMHSENSQTRKKVLLHVHCTMMYCVPLLPGSEKILSRSEGNFRELDRDKLWLAEKIRTN